MRQNKLISGLAFVALSLGFGGCGHSHGDNLQDCVKEHMEEKLSEVDAITECLVDELGKNFATQSECEAFVTANGNYPTKTAACEHYFDEKKPATDAGTGN